MAKQPKNKKDGVQPSWSRKPLSEDQKRSMSVATRKFNKSFKPASGKVEFTADKLAQDYIMSGGPVVGFGTKSSSAIDLKKGPKNPGQSTPDAGESEFGYAKRPKRQEPLDKEFVRKSTTKKVLTRPTKKVLTKIESKKSTKK
jgi:hypothetical protein